MEKLPLLIYNQEFLLERIQGQERFHPQEISIVFIKNGSIEFLVNGHEKNYADANILFISPKNIYELKKISNDIKLFVIGIQASYRNYINRSFNRFDAYRAITVEQNNALKIPKNDFDSLWGVLQNMFYQMHIKKDASYKNEIIIHSFSAITYSIVNHLENIIIPNKEIETNKRKETITLNFIELASENFIEEKELKFYANKLFISVKYLSICVKEVTGFPPSYFLVQLIVDAACGRLRNVDNSISNIADDLNFSDQFAFAKFFKKNMRLTPSSFRRKTSQMHTI